MSARLMTLWVGVAMAGCGRPSEPLAPDAAVAPDASVVSSDAGVADAGSQPRFDAEQKPTGAGLWVEADLTNPARPRLEVWARNLGQVFGVAFHVKVDAAVMQLDEASTELALGPDARHLEYLLPGDVAFALVRPGPSAGEQDLTAPTRLAVMQLSSLSTSPTAVTFSRVQARRIDGSFVPLTAVGGLLTGGAP